jgi:hypothetical protein
MIPRHELGVTKITIAMATDLPDTLIAARK